MFPCFKAVGISACGPLPIPFHRYKHVSSICQAPTHTSKIFCLRSLGMVAAHSTSWPFLPRMPKGLQRIEKTKLCSSLAIGGNLGHVASMRATSNAIQHHYNVQLATNLYRDTLAGAGRSPVHPWSLRWMIDYETSPRKIVPTP